MLKHIFTPYYKVASLLLVLSGTFFCNQAVIAHGSITSPPSRVYSCFLEGPENPQSAACQAAVAVSGPQGFYDWNGVANGSANGNHTRTCSGGSAGHAGLDLSRDDWPATSIPGGPTNFTWTLTAPHATLYYRYYMNGSLFCEIGPSGREPSVTHTCNVPGSGRQTIWSVWQRSDSPEAFYACVDVIIGGSGSSGGSSSGGSGSSGGSSSGGSGSSGGSSSGGSGSGGGSCSSQQYAAGSSYSNGDFAQNLGNEYRCDVAGWCSSSAAWAYEPGVGLYWQSAWTLSGSCSGGGSSSGGSSSGGSGSSGGSSSGGSGGGSCSSAPTWSSSAVYTGGNQVQYNGVLYQAKWWTQGDNPAQNSNQWGVWDNLGNC